MQSNNSSQFSDINITPFVDVVLVLLVIFMVTAPMIAQQVLDIKLPSAESADSVSTEALGLAVTAKGQFLLNGKLIDQESLKIKTQDAVKKNKNVQVVIAADGDSPHRFVIKAIDIIKKSGVENFAFQVKSEVDSTVEQENASEETIDSNDYP